MKQYWTKFELAESWQLSQEEILCIQNKHNKLGYAIKMKYFDNIGRFPTTDKEIPYVIKEHLAKQLSAPVTSIKAYKWTGRHAQIHNAEIRERYGYRKFDYKDLTSIDSLIKNSLFVQDLSVLQTQEEVYTFLKKHKIEPPADKELTRYVSKSFNKCESKFFARCFNNMSPEIKESLCSLFEEYEDDQSKLSILKELVGKASIKTIKEELQKLALLEKTQILYEEFFERIPYKLLKKYHDRVAISSPSSLLKIKQNDISKFYALLACFCKYKGGKIIDNLIEILTRKVERWHSIAKGKVKETLWAEYTHDDKDKLLDDLVDISLAYPEGVIKEKIYPGVGGKEKLEKSKLSRQSIKARLKKLEYEYMSRVYIPARASLLEILNRLILKSNSPSAILDAAQCFSRKEPLNIKGLLNKVEILAFSNEAGELNKMSQEVAMFSLLRKELKCKNIWAKGALKCCDPNKDVPKDFNQNKAKYFEMVPVSPSAEEETLKLKNEMLKWIKVFNTSILTDPDVRIEPKKGKPHIYVTPYGPGVTERAVRCHFDF